MNLIGSIAVFAILGIVTHGFDHFDHMKNNVVLNDNVPIVDGLESENLTHIKIVLVSIMVSRVFWLAFVILCLVGLHKVRNI